MGLAEILCGELDVVAACQTTAIVGLHILASGQPPRNPAELLSGPELSGVLQRARQEYDLMLVDSPPVLAVSDTCLAGAACDAM